jgi:FAD:protein FMN transferase
VQQAQHRDALFNVNLVVETASKPLQISCLVAAQSARKHVVDKPAEKPDNPKYKLHIQELCGNVPLGSLFFNKYPNPVFKSDWISMNPLQNSEIGKIPTTGNRASAASCLVITVALVLFLSAGIYALQSYFTGSADTGRQSAAAETPSSFTLEEVRPGWWETSDLIYFGIPARVVFHLPMDAAIAPGALAAEIWNEFEKIGKIFNPFDPDSETAQLNAADKRNPIPVSKEMHEVLLISRKLWEVSSGAFDPTMLPVKQMWAEAVSSQQIPSNREILKTMSDVGFENVVITDQTIKLKNTGIRFDFGGIAKGYAVDQVAALLLSHDIPSALISLAGEIRTIGSNNENPWRLGIQHPEDMNALWGVVSAERDISVSTSGNYRQPLLIAGREFYHIFSPETGRPVSEKISSVSTLCDSETISNALLDGAATAIIVLGAENGKEFAEKLGIETLILVHSRSGKIDEIMTPGFNARYEPR